MLTPQANQLALLLRGSGSAEEWALPWDVPGDEATLDEIASRLARRIIGTTPPWIEQIGAFGDRTRHPGDADISVAFVALVPLGTPAPEGEEFAWFRLDELPVLPERHRVIARHAVSMVRDHIDLSPVAFRLLPVSFTLSELQQMYELLLGKRLHKASFRRALQAAWLVEPTDEWRSEGRGRPAQLYQYAPKKRKKGRRGVRFDLLTP